MPTESHTEFRVRRIDPTRPGEDITWHGPHTSRDTADVVAHQDSKEARRRGTGDTFAVERRTVTTTSTEWEPAP